MKLGRTRALAIVGVAAAAALGASVLEVIADDEALTLTPVADTTVTQVPQDGDTSVKTTLASCPQLCDGNPNGQRDAVLEFNVTKLPANAVDVTATLRVYAWHDVAARVVARSLPGGPASAAAAEQAAPRTTPGATAAALADSELVEARDHVVQGYNEFDVSTVVRRNGVHTFALRQEDYHSRVYWASKENQRPAIRPELTLSFTTGTARPTPSAATAPAPPATSDPPTPPTPTPTRPSAEASTPAADPSTARPPTGDPGQPPAPAPAGWRPIWADEFNDHTIDKSKWNVRDGEGRDVDLGCNVDDPKNSFESGGRLTIRALNETTRCGSQTRPYTQAYLDTIGKASFTYGRFEMRAKSPNQKASSQGLWPAFWLRPDGGGNGEIDVVELPGGQDWYDKATLGIFWDYTPVKQDTRVALPSGYPGDGFHTYTTEWEPGVLRWYLDGKLVWQRDRNTTPWFDKAFSRPYNIRLNFQVGGWLGNPTGSTAFPADFAVDYVRVWQR